MILSEGSFEQELSPRVVLLIFSSENCNSKFTCKYETINKYKYVEISIMKRNPRQWSLWCNICACRLF